MKWRAWCCALLLGGVAGCSDTLPVSVLKPLSSTKELHIVWSASVGKKNQEVIAPTLAYDNLYLVGGNGDLVSLDPVTGKENWRMTSSVTYATGVGSGDDQLYIGDKQGNLLAYSKSGILNWQVHLSDELMTPPEAGDSTTVVARTADGHVYGLDGSDGHQLWMVTRPMPPLVLHGDSGIRVSRGAAFVAYPGGRLMALNLLDGRVGWETLITIPLGSTELERVNDVMGFPVLGYSDICVAAFQNKVTCLDAAKGETLWSHDMEAAGPVEADDGRLFVTDEKGTLVALNQLTGSVVWKTDDLDGRYPSPPAVTRNFVVVGDEEGYVHYFSREDGHEVARLQTKAVSLVKVPVPVNEDQVVVINEQGKVFSVAPVNN